MPADGYIKLWRKVFDSTVWSNPKLWRFWCWCLLKASYKEHVAMVGYKEVSLQPGQFIFGLYNACKETGLTLSNVRTAIKYLVGAGKLTINSTNKYSIISIVNWAQYQEELTNKPQANDKLVSPNKNSKNSNKDNTIQFDVFWSAYPKKVGKKDTVKAFTKLNPTQELLETILTKLDVLKKSDSWTRGYIPNPATFLNGERWNDEPIKTTAQGKPKQQIGADGWPLGL